jgi:hypothetical protein
VLFVLSNTIVPATFPLKLPLCTPVADEDVWNVEVAVVIAVALGIVPAPVATPVHLPAPTPEAKPFVQFAMSEKFSR